MYKQSALGALPDSVFSVLRCKSKSLLSVLLILRRKILLGSVKKHIFARFSDKKPHLHSFKYHSK